MMEPGTRGNAGGTPMAQCRRRALVDASMASAQRAAQMMSEDGWPPRRKRWPPVRLANTTPPFLRAM
jgi:hypothetical protein